MIKYALRFLLRQKLFTIINILGLALSLACCIVLSRYLHQEATVDSHAVELETIVAPYYIRSNGGNGIYTTTSSLEYYYEPAIKTDLQQMVKESCDYIVLDDAVIEYEGKTWDCGALVVEDNFLNFFRYEVTGDKEALKRPDGMWASRRMLQKMGLTDEEAMGRSINLRNNTFTVCGIYDEPACKTLYRPDFICSMHHPNSMSRMSSQWLRIAPDYDLEAMNERMRHYGRVTHPDNSYNDSYHAEKTDQFLYWKDYYMRNDFYVGSSNLETHGNRRLNLILCGVMVLVLLVGVMNFFNLFCVLWQRRQHEEGVRRVFGQSRWNLFSEIWLELQVVALIAVFFAWLFVELSAPWVETLLGDKIYSSAFDVVLTMGITICLPLVVWAYPYVKQLGRSPLTSLQQRSGSVQSIRSRIWFLAGQYLLMFCLLTFALWLHSHLAFLVSSPTGFDYEHILLAKPCSFSNREDAWEGDYFSKGKELKQRLLEAPFIEAVDMTEALPAEGMTDSGYETVFLNQKDEVSQVHLYRVDEDWFTVFGIRLEEGDLLKVDRSNIEEMNRRYDQYLVNRRALKLFGYNNITDGMIRSQRAMEIGWDPETQTTTERGNTLVPIVGVVSDHYQQHRTLGTTPCVYYIEKNGTNFSAECVFAIRVMPGHDAEALELFQQLQQELYPGKEAKWHWFEEDVKRMYERDEAQATSFSVFAAIAIVICCLGLLGISLFDIRQRYKEIAIRKANGAHRRDLYLRLGKKYLYLLLFTFVLSIPVSYVLIHQYTESFIESAPLSPWIYLEALAIVLLITLLTLIYQLEKAARVNVAIIVKTE